MHWIFLATALAFFPQVEVPSPPQLALEAYTLPNGLKVALHRDPSVPRVSVCVGYHVGSKNEKAGKTGFAHFFEHMMFRGTKNVNNYDIPLQEAGAQSNAFTSEDMTVYFETVPSNFLERALYLEAERLAFLPSALDQEKFDTEREVVKNERRQSSENQPYGLDSETILAHVFPKGHPYSWSVIGSMADLSRASLDDLRAFFDEFYHPANATLCLAGDFDPDQARALIARYFGPLKPGPKPGSVVIAPVPPTAKKLKRYDAVKLPRVYWNWPTVADDHPDAPALDLLATILAGGETSRLYKSLILEKRLGTEVSTDSDTKESAGLFTLQCTADESADPNATLSAIEAVFLETIKQIATNPPKADELARALALFEKSNYAMLTPPLMRAFTFVTGFAQKDDPAYYQKDFSRYFQVTLADVQRVAARYLTPEKVVLWSLPVDSEHPKSEAAVAGPNPSNIPEAVATDRRPEGGPDWSKMPGPSDPLGFNAPRFVRKTLSNGLDVWVAPWKTLPLVSVRLLIPSGTADDPKGQSGLATLTATLLTQGTKTRTTTELAEALEDLGVTLGAGASADETATGFSTVARNLDPALRLLGEVLTSPRFDPTDFDRERNLQLASLLQGTENAGWMARRAFPVLLFGQGHPYANPSEGYPETLKTLAIEDVRRFHGKQLGPKGSILIAVGDVQPEALFEKVEATLGGWKAQEVSPSARPEPTLKTSPGLIFFVDKPGAVQSIVSVGRRWLDRKDESYFAALVGNRILGGDFLSRLNQNLREKNGFTYGASSVFRFQRTGSVWSVSTQVRTDATAPALKEALGELDGLAGGRPFTAEEIDTAVGAEVKSFPEGFENPGSIARILEEMAQFGLPPDYLDTYLDRLQSTRPESIGQAMARVIEPRERVVLIVGDRQSVEPKLRDLGYNQIEFIDYNGRSKK